MSRCIYLIRHAEPARSPAAMSKRAPPGPELTERGQRQAQELAAFLAVQELTGLYASPYLRTRQTVAPLTTRIGLDPIFTDAIRETPDAEATPDVFERLEAFLTEITHQEGPIAIVTHGTPLRVLIYIASAGAVDIINAPWKTADNPTPMACVWRLSQELPGTAWTCELIYQPAPDEDASSTSLAA